MHSVYPMPHQEPREAMSVAARQHTAVTVCAEMTAFTVCADLHMICHQETLEALGAVIRDASAELQQKEEEQRRRHELALRRRTLLAEDCDR